MYSRRGVNAIKMVVATIKNIADKPTATNTLSLVNLNENRSSKVSSLRTTILYLCSSFLVNFFFAFLFVAIAVINYYKDKLNNYLLHKLE